MVVVPILLPKNLADANPPKVCIRHFQHGTNTKKIIDAYAVYNCMNEISYQQTKSFIVVCSPHAKNTNEAYDTMRVKS
jgi:hypothetical protein